MAVHDEPRSGEPSGEPLCGGGRKLPSSRTTTPNRTALCAHTSAMPPPDRPTDRPPDRTRPTTRRAEREAPNGRTSIRRQEAPGGRCEKKSAYCAPRHQRLRCAHSRLAALLGLSLLAARIVRRAFMSHRLGRGAPWLAPLTARAARVSLRRSSSLACRSVLAKRSASGAQRFFFA